ncbi:MAG: phage antirepressor KilAC domain-containing protein [Desulfobacteraceae bacterium]|jgi:hypothetical protein
MENKTSSLKAVAKELSMNHKELIASLIRDGLLIRIDGHIEPRAIGIIKGFFTLETGFFGRLKKRVAVTHDGWSMIANRYSTELREV